jgi:membrane protein insertase Oxa1/YidC/SpoIIIJ
METLIQKHEFDLKSGSSISQKTIQALQAEIEAIEKKLADKDLLLK